MCQVPLMTMVNASRRCLCFMAAVFHYQELQDEAFPQYNRRLHTRVVCRHHDPWSMALKLIAHTLSVLGGGGKMRFLLWPPWTS